MPLLGPLDPMPSGRRRVLVAGTSGSGKTTLAARIGRRWGLPHTEIDALHHGPGWSARPEFLSDVRALADADAWVTEWQYDDARPLLLRRAQLMIWLDLPRRTVMRQVTARTVRRRVRRETLWNGNVEQGLWRILVDPEHIIRWAWTSHPATAARVIAAHGECPELPIIRLRRRRDVDSWLARAPVGR